MDNILILSTAGSTESALDIARTLVSEKLAACVNIVPGARSIYRWQGKVCDEAECLLLIKSSEGLFESIRARIRQIHPYQVPEIITLPISAGDVDYLNWLQEQLSSESRG